MFRCQRKPQGFTLIELLVVIAIIGVLIAIIFPTLGRIRQNARKTTCLANLHQIQVAMQQYVTEAGGFLPSWCITHPNPNSAPDPKSEPSASILTWDVVLHDYLKSEELLVCLANPVAGKATGGDPGASASNARAYAMPRYTQWDFDPDPDVLQLAGVEVARIPNPVLTVLLFEKGANRPGTWGDALGENAYQSHDCRDHLSEYRDDMFHSGGKNFLFVDGHADWFKGGLDPAWDRHETITIPDPPDPSVVDPSSPFTWDSGRRDGATGSNCGPGVMEIAAPWDKGGDWPPAEGTWPP